VDWRYDEVLNPSAYEPDVESVLRETLQDRRDQVCTDRPGLPESLPEHEQVWIRLDPDVPEPSRVFLEDEACGDTGAALPPPDALGAGPLQGLGGLG
jgi:hypothetical protein